MVGPLCSPQSSSAGSDEASTALDGSYREILAGLSYPYGRAAVILPATESPRSREEMWTMLRNVSTRSRSDGVLQEVVHVV